MAKPGLAADDLVPDVEIPAPPGVPTIAPVTVPPPDSTQPPAPESNPSESAAPEPPITVSVNADGGNVDVSVRVLSPGADADDAVEPPVISGSDGPDITTDAAPASGAPADATGDGAPGTNTNVTVRVLSPGDSGLVGQSNPLEGAEPGNDTAGAAAKTETPAAPGGEGSAGAASDSAIPSKEDAQYQSSDSRYQSSDQFADDAWIWTWYLSLDCDGNPTSSSTEAGRESSRDWTWEWTWEWSCGSPPRPPPVDSLEPAVDSDATREAPALSEGEATSTPPARGTTSGDVAAPEPWLWTWTFTFCGETVTATLPISAAATLEWAWEWMWTWTCGAESAPELSGDAPDPPAHHPSPAPASGATTQPGAHAPSADIPGALAPEVEPSIPWFVPVDLPAWVISLLPFPEFGLGATIRLVPVFDPVTRGGLISTLADVAPIPLPSVVVPGAPVTVPGSSPTFVTPLISPSGSQRREALAATVPVATGSSPSRRAEPHSAEPRLEKASPRAKRHSAGRRSGDTPLTPWPPLRPFQAAAAPGASSGFVPSTSVLGTAALVALFVLAAPGFGRRVRVARELRPRGTFGSSIDHPG